MSVFKHVFDLVDLKNTAVLLSTAGPATASVLVLLVLTFLSRFSS